ncbi:MAG TPA: glutamate carboxypeptidase [Steroidobacteraceae bacterium]|jgi:glutamate carboxypeptidase|nr:glutamate carboxypeptidase [Steroidobacteraceae bacterium]
MSTRQLAACILPIALIASVAGPAAAAARRDDQVYRAVEANRAAALELLEEIVNIDSGTGDVAGGAKVEAVLRARLTQLGAEVRSEPAEAPGLPDNLVAVFHGTGRGKILIVAHVDTVFGPGTAAARPFSMDKDRAHGPGVGDEKAGVVNAVTALKILHDLGFKNFATITLLLDDSEERGSPGSTKLIKRLAREHDVEFNMEPGDPPDALTVWRKGSSSIHIEVKGRAAHAGMAPQDGRNAAVELMHQLSALQSAFPTYGDGITVNLTVMRSGERNNIIPDRAEAVLNVRYRKPEEFDAVLAKVEAGSHRTQVPDTTVSISHDPAFPPLTENPQIDALAARARAIYAEIGKTVALSGNGGASESALAMSEGTPALDGLGFVGGDFHTDHEWIDLNSVAPRLYLFTRLLMQTGAK